MNETNDATTSAVQGGYLHLLPTYLPEGLTVSEFAFAANPWLSPAYSGVIGTTADGDPAMAVTFEAPYAWLRTVEPLDKATRERLYVGRFSADKRLASGTHAFAAMRPGNDPPDIIVSTDSGDVGVESTTLTVRDRRLAHALFNRVRQRVLQEDPVRFSRLAGHVVYMWFEQDAGGGLALPYKSSDDDAAEALVNALAEYRPNPQQLLVVNGVPNRAPSLPVSSTTDGAVFYAVPLVGSVPATFLFSIAGFEVGLAYTSLVTAQEALSELQRLVGDHDQPGVDVLLISAGAPDSAGIVYPSEEAQADFMAAHASSLGAAPEHIGHIALHWWSTGRAISLYPSVEPLFGPLYNGTVPINHPLYRPSPTSVPSVISPGTATQSAPER